MRVFAGDAVIAGVLFGLSTLSVAAVRPSALSAAVFTASAAWVLALFLVRGYDVRRLGAGPEELQAIIRAAGLAMAVLVMGAYASDVVLPRRYVFLCVPAIALATAIYRYRVRRWLQRRRHQGQAVMRTLVVGSPNVVSPLVTDLGLDRHHGYLVVGTCVPIWSSDLPEGMRVPTLGAVGDVPQVVVDQDVDAVIVAGGSLSGRSLRRLSWALDRVGADLIVAPGLVELAGPHVSLRPTAGLSLLHLEVPSRHVGRELGKSLLDHAVGVVLLVVMLLPLLVLMAAVRLSGPGPIFFRQTRMGVDGRPFTMYKLRTMVVDADRHRDELVSLSDRDGLMFKMHHDPRVTRVGRVLRRYSLDELPQLWNVVRGDMSLVGPRPPLPEEHALYHDAVNRRLRVRPGMTGLWQVSGRADLDWEQSVNLDLRYVDNWSLALDLQILWKTARAVLRGAGAY